MSISDVPLAADVVKAQEILLQLNLVLTTLASSSSSSTSTSIPSGASSLQLTKKLFIPPPPHQADAHQPLSALRILPPLREMQQEVATWIDGLKAAVSPEGEGSVEGPVPTQSAPRRAQPLPRSGNNLTESQLFSELLPPPKIQLKSADAGIAPSAQQAVVEVRSAISFLATSTAFGTGGAPKQGALRNALQQIQPMLDQFIETLQKTVNRSILPVRGKLEVAEGNRQPTLRNGPDKPLWQQPQARSMPIISTMPSVQAALTPQATQPATPQGVPASHSQQAPKTDVQTPALFERAGPIGPLPFPTVFSSSTASMRRKEKRRLTHDPIPPRHNLWDEDDPKED